MPERPVNNLPPGSQPWAREIAGAIDAAQFDAIKANMNNKNAFKTINATLEQLTEQQAKLSEQITRIDSLVNSQIYPASASPATTTGWSVSGSGVFNTMASTSISVPSGYSRAIVMATGSVTYQTPSTVNRFDIRVGVGGSWGPALPNLANPVGCSAASYTRTYTGLSGGTISLDMQVAVAASEGASAANTATVTGFAVFLR